ncbi:hypothetical protein CCP2SC5_190040 [Azospirillaceae bacterium]
MIMSSGARIANQIYNIELRHLPLLHQEIISYWLDIIPNGETLPKECDFYEKEFDLSKMDFKPDSFLGQFKEHLVVLKEEVFGDAADWRYLYKGPGVKKDIVEDKDVKIIEYVSQIENPFERDLIRKDLDTLKMVQLPHRRRLIWRPYSGYFGHDREHKTFVRIAMPFLDENRQVHSCVVLVMEALFDGRGIIELN